VKKGREVGRESGEDGWEGKGRGGRERRMKEEGNQSRVTVTKD
jgi:hypothetical protein